MSIQLFDATQVMVKMKSRQDDAEWLWDKNKFMNRKFIMQEMYQNYVEGEDWDVEKVSGQWMKSCYKCAFSRMTFLGVNEKGTLNPAY